MYKGSRKHRAFLNGENLADNTSTKGINMSGQVSEMITMVQFNTWCFFCTNKILPAEVHLEDNAAIVFVNYGGYCEPMSCAVRDGNVYGVEIRAKTKEEAKYIADILCACHTIIEGVNMETSEDIIQRFDKDPDMHVVTEGVLYPDNALMDACQLLQKVYGNQSLENAVCKYYVAHDIYHLHPMALHPMEDPFVSEYLLSERIRIANVIVDCYAVLEELNMQIKAGKDNPSVIDGQWNPNVKQELFARLQKKNIDPHKCIPWLSRNGVIRPFKVGVVKVDELCEWSDGESICDFKISICDAILELSYMRSQLSSHNLGEKVLKLSVYDANNAFWLARYLMAKYFGWDLCPD